MSLRNVALPVRANGEQRLRRARYDYQASPEHRRGGYLAVKAVNSPEFGAIRSRISNDTGDRQGNDLPLAGGFNYDGRGPVAAHLARGLPDDLAGAAVQCVEFRQVVFIVALVELDDQPVVPCVQRGG